MKIQDALMNVLQKQCPGIHNNRLEAVLDVAQGLSQIISDPNFMNKYGKSQLWNDVKVFMAARDAIVGIYNSLPEGSQQKTNLKVGYQNYIADTISQWHPQLQKIINRYFDNDTFKAVR
jgi:hypothetical protein